MTRRLPVSGTDPAVKGHNQLRLEALMGTKISLIVAAASISGVLAGCGGAAKNYDIGPIFPLSSDKCARYGGTQEGSGITAKCMVTKAECEKAAADWHDAMQSSGVNDATEFTCD